MRANERLQTNQEASTVPGEAHTILDEHPDLEAEDIAEALHYAAAAVRERELPLRQPA